MKIIHVDFKKKKLQYTWEERSDWKKDHEKATVLCTDLLQITMNLTKNTAYTKYIGKVLGKFLHELEIQAEELTNLRSEDRE